MEDYIFGFLFGLLLIGVVVLLPVMLVVDTNNYNHKPCDWFVANNYSIGDTPLRCKENLK